MPKTRWFDRSFEFSLTVADFQPVLERLRRAPERVGGLVATLPEEVLAERPDETWSIKENVGHLSDLEPLWVGRLDDIVSGKPTLRPADLTNRRTHEANHNAASLEELLSRFRAARHGTVARLAGLRPSAVMRSSIHPRLETPMRVIDLFHFVAEHDEHHLERIGEIIATFARRA